MEFKQNIYLYGAIDDNVAAYVMGGISFYNEIALEGDTQPINIIINSPGGKVTAGNAIIDQMNLSKLPVNTVVLGEAASMAAVIASCGKKRFIGENARMMIHDVSAGAFGGIEDIKNATNEINRMSDQMLNMLAKNTMKPISVLKEDVYKKDLFMDATESVRYGLVDNVLTQEIAKSIKLSESFNTESKEINSKLSEVPLIMEGLHNSSYGKIKVTEEIIDSIISSFDSGARGIDVSIDYTHENDNGEKPAALWINSLEKRDIEGVKHLYAIGEFTPDGKKLIKEKVYKYASAEFV